MVIARGHSVVIYLIVLFATVPTPIGCLFSQKDKMTASSPNDHWAAIRVFAPDAVLRLNPDNGTILFLKAKNLFDIKNETLPNAKTPAAIALSFIDRYKAQFKLKQPQDELKCLSATTDDLGLTHVRFQQIYQGIPVWGAEVNVHLNRNNIIYLVQGRYIPTPNHIRLQPSLNSHEALECVLKEIGSQKVNKDQSAIELIIFSKSTQRAALAYKVTVPGWIYFVDAVDGCIVNRLPARHTNHLEILPKTVHPGGK